VAREFRSQGAESAELISAEADKRGRSCWPMPDAMPKTSEAGAMRNRPTFTRKSFGKNAEFYDFYRSLQAYQTAVEKPTILWC